MVSRDSKVQLAVVAATMAMATLWVRFGTPTPVASGVFVGSMYVFLFAGSHAYLALRGDGDDVPVGARWRFVGLVCVAVVALLLGNGYPGIELLGQTLPSVVQSLVAAGFVGYVAYEAWDAYRATRPS